MSEESLRVLIVEDRPADVRLVLHELQQAGFKPDMIQADTEAEFLGQLESAPDVILCDYFLPQFDAMRALELIQERQPGIPFLIVSGSIGEETAVELIKRGANDYLLKDRLGRLGPAVKQALKQRELRQAEVHAQKLLQERDARLQLALDAAGMGVWEWIIPTSRVFWSPECYKLLGVDTFVGTYEAFEKFLHPDDSRRFKVEIEAAIAQRAAFVTEFRVIRPDGQVRWLANFGRATYSDDGSPLQMVGTAQDITERKQAEESLRENRLFLEQAQRIAGLGTWVSGPTESDALWWSDQTYKIFGQSREQFDARVGSFFDAVYPDDRAAVEEASRAVLAGERPYEIEHRIIRPDGTIRWVHQLAEVIRDANGQVLQMIGIVRDVTKRREQEEALRASQAMLKLVLDTIPQGVFWKDRNSAFLGANRVTRQAMGFAVPESLFGLTDFDLPTLTREQAEFFVRVDRKVMDSDQPHVGIEEPMTLPDGSTIWLDTNKVPMHDPDGHVIGVLGTWQDVTERKRLNDELRASRERLQVLSRQLMNAQENERRHIARELHDEIGQALTGIKLNLNAMQRMEQDETATLVLQDTLTIANQTLEQVRNLSLDLRPSMLDDLGLSAALRWYLDRQARRAGFTAQFIAESSGTGMSKEIETACFRIAQECLTNIARHARARNVRMEVRQHDTELELLVQDDGVGFNVSAASERAIQGESMGLLSMQERVLLLGGRLEIESSATGGTQMCVRFPHVSVTPQAAK